MLAFDFYLQDFTRFYECGENVGKVKRFCIFAENRCDMTISFILKRSKAGFSMDDTEGGATIYVRLRDGRMLDSTTTTGMLVNPLWWDAKREEVKAKIICENAEKAELNESIKNLKTFLNTKYKTDKEKGKIDRDWLAKAIKEFTKNKGHAVVSAAEKTHPFKKVFQDFLNERNFDAARQRQYRVLERAVYRFEEYIRVTKPRRKNFIFDVRLVDENDLADLYDFMSNEHIYYEKYPNIYEKFPEKRQSKPRGANTLAESFKKLRTIFNWAIAHQIIAISPFTKFKCEKELYGTPYYLTKEEMLKILNTDLSETPHLEMQRDIFIFHCCIGCRVSDLRRLKKTDVINGGIEYIATKTIAENAGTVRVPLNATAQAIIEKYKDHSEEALLPFVYDQKYNEAIKLVLTKCEITRMVTILNSLTRKEEKKPINEIGSSHLARRTFIANLYNKVQDPNVIGSMTGHVEGSRAFARYRTIEEEVKKSLVDILR